MPTVLVTGANRGLGLELARQYAADGWRVIATCRSPESADDLNSLADVSEIQVESLDVTDHGQIEDLASRLTGEPIDVLLNNAGIIGPIPIPENISRQWFGSIDYKVWEQVIRVNTFGPVKMAECFLENVAASAQKKIVTLSSSVGSITERKIEAFAYGSSKAALNKAMNLLAEKLRDRDIIVTLICPGRVKTRMDFGNAELEIPESTSAVRALIADFTLEDTGSFTRYDGHNIAW